MFSIPLLQAEKKEEGKQGASTKKRASAAQLRITKVIFNPSLKFDKINFALCRT